MFQSVAHHQAQAPFETLAACSETTFDDMVDFNKICRYCAAAPVKRFLFATCFAYMQTLLLYRSWTPLQAAA